MSEQRPFVNIPTGEYIKDELEALGWTQEEFAEVLGMSVKGVNEILTSKTALTIETAQLIGRAFGTSAQLWLNIDATYRLRLMEDSDRARATGLQADLRRYVPIREMQKLGWLPESKDPQEVIQWAQDFWEVKEPRFSFLDRRPEPVYRRTRSREAFEKYHGLAWEQKARREATKLNLPPFHIEQVKALAVAIPTMSLTTDGVSRWIGELFEAGVGFLVLRHLSKTYLDGAALVVGKNPVVMYTGRYNRIDHFWFTVAHELAHIVLEHVKGDGAGILDDMKDDAGDAKEREADVLAARWLQHDAILAFCEPFRGYLSRSRVEKCSTLVGVHPAIVVGTLQHHGLLSYKNLNDLKGSVLDLIPSQWKVG